MPTGPSSADLAPHPGPAASLALMLGLRARGLRTPTHRRRRRRGAARGRHRRVGHAPVAALAPSWSTPMRRYLPVGFLAFVVDRDSGPVRRRRPEALPADQVVAYPLGPTTDHLAGLILSPLNLAWLLQAWTLLAGVRCPRARRTLGGRAPVVLWLVAVTVGVQWLSWVVEYVRRGPRGELVVRAGRPRGLVIVLVVSTGHLLDAALDARGLGLVVAAPRSGGTGSTGCSAASSSWPRRWAWRSWARVPRG